MSSLKSNGTIQVSAELKAHIAGLTAQKRISVAAEIFAQKSNVLQARRMQYLTACGLTTYEILAAMDLASGGALVRSAMGHRYGHQPK